MENSNREIERKYIVTGEFNSKGINGYYIRQGFLLVSSSKVVRIRIADNRGFITVKGEQNGITRFEWEKEISVGEAEQLLKLCDPFIIEKTRYIINFRGQKFEVDVFEKENKGLVIAEIELEYENQEVLVPDWIGKEVSTDFRYSNASLSKKPFTLWDG